MLKNTYRKHNTQKPVLNDGWQTVRVPCRVGNVAQGRAGCLQIKKSAVVHVFLL